MTQRVWTCKPEVEINDVMSISPHLLGILASFIVWSQERGLPVNVTSMIDKSVIRVSDTHIQGRAVDVSARGWDKESINKVVAYINKKYASIGAIGIKDGIPRAIVYHDAGHGAHFHLQVRKNIQGVKDGESKVRVATSH